MLKKLHWKSVLAKAKADAKSSAVVIDYEAAEAQAFLKKPDGLRVPTFLDRVEVKTKEQIGLTRAAALENAKHAKKLNRRAD